MYGCMGAHAHVFIHAEILDGGGGGKMKVLCQGEGVKALVNPLDLSRRVGWLWCLVQWRDGTPPLVVEERVRGGGAPVFLDPVSRELGLVRWPGGTQFLVQWYDHDSPIL